jgi:uncharacterized membrane protein YjdF
MPFLDEWHLEGERQKQFAYFILFIYIIIIALSSCYLSARLPQEYLHHAGMDHGILRSLGYGSRADYFYAGSFYHGIITYPVFHLFS